jgi:four helix bundle protein
MVIKMFIMDGKKLEDLEIYKIAVELSALACQVFECLPYQHKCHIGSQFLDAIDSIGANIAEGFGRYHYRDSLKFYYYSRGSLYESKHWIYLLKTRNLVNSDMYEIMLKCLKDESVKLNNFINSLKEKIN